MAGVAFRVGDLTARIGDGEACGVARGKEAPHRYSFSQRERDPESALMHYRARSYDPAISAASRSSGSPCA